MTHTTDVYFDNGGDSITIEPTGTVDLTGNVASVGTLTAGTSLLVNTTSVLTGAVTFGNGYAGTGATMTALGALSLKGALVVDGAETVTGAATHSGATTFGNGYAGTGATMTALGALSMKGALIVAGASTLTGDVAVGSSKATITAATGLLTLDGGATNPAIKCTGAGSVSGTTAGTAYTSGAPSLCAAQLSMRVYIGTTPYRIPLWADA